MNSSDIFFLLYFVSTEFEYHLKSKEFKWKHIVGVKFMWVHLDLHLSKMSKNHLKSKWIDIFPSGSHLFFQHT